MNRLAVIIGRDEIRGLLGPGCDDVRGSRQGDAKGSSPRMLLQGKPRPRRRLDQVAIPAPAIFTCAMGISSLDAFWWSQTSLNCPTSQIAGSLLLHIIHFAGHK